MRVEPLGLTEGVVALDHDPVGNLPTVAIPWLPIVSLLQLCDNKRFTIFPPAPFRLQGLPILALVHLLVHRVRVHEVVQSLRRLVDDVVQSLRYLDFLAREFHELDMQLADLSQ